MKFEDFYLRDLFRILWNGKWVIAAVMVLTIGYSANHVFRVAVPQYGASARLVFTSPASEFSEIGSILSGFYIDEATINTEIAIIRSRGVIEKLVEELDLTADPEFNAALRPAEEPGLLPSPDDIKAWISDLLSPSAPSETVQTGPAVAAMTAEEKTLNRTVAAVLSAITVTPRREAYILDINAVTRSAAKSALIANTLARIYFEDQVAAKLESVEYSVTWMTNRVDELNRELQDRQEEVRAFRAGAEVTDPRQLEALQLRRIDLAGRLADLEATAARAAERTALLEGLIADPTEPEMEALGDPLLAQILSEGLTASNRAAAVERLGTLLDEAERAMSRGREQQGAVAQSLSDLEAEIADGAGQIDELTQLEFAVDATQQLYETLLLQQKESASRLGIQQADGRVLSRAIPGQLVSPRKAATLVFSAFLGFLVGTALVLIWSQFRGGVRSIEEIEQISDAPVIGQLPLIRQRSRRRFVDYLVSKPTSHFVESIRNLRTSLLLAEAGAAPKVIVVSSSIPNEGKTSLSVALAANLAGISGKVLLVEGDIRRNSLSQYIAGAGDAGLIDVIERDLPVAEAVHREERIGIDILQSGTGKVIAADFFSGPGFARFIESMRETYDHIVIDTPPVLVVPDARIIARHGDALVYCIHWGRAVPAQVRQGVRELAAVGVAVTGFALTQVDFSRMRRDGYEGYGQHGYGGRSSARYYG